MCTTAVTSVAVIVYNMMLVSPGVGTRPSLVTRASRRTLYHHVAGASQVVVDHGRTRLKTLGIVTLMALTHTVGRRRGVVETLNVEGTVLVPVVTVLLMLVSGADTPCNQHKADEHDASTEQVVCSRWHG